ncbi:MAG: glycosyltransferase family 2 protein [Clostridia bacterium]|nr:glycosyltransferase family 2 protein [Clostridia bacterium]
MSDSIQISIICFAYNHEKYIRQCLDGFLMQKDVTFEIIIHDDASTDKTQDIIREYENKYPDLFRPIYQTENKYSTHNNLESDFIVQHITGDFVAVCEGDDFWTDPYKLKKQYDALEANPECLMCAHKVRVANSDGTDAGYSCPRNDIKTVSLPVGYICDNYENAKYIHTSSLFLRADIYKKYLYSPPTFREVAPVGDIPLLLYFTSLGKIYFMNEVMSVYRFMSDGSWSYRNKNDPEKESRRREIDKKMVKMFSEFCRFTDNKYYEDLKCEIDKYRQNEYWYCIEHHDYKSLFKEFSIKELEEFGLGRKARLKMRLQMWFPRIFV